VDVRFPTDLNIVTAGVDAVGGTGGAGLGPVWDAPAVPVDNSSRILLPRIETVVFCNNYDLDDEICKLLTDQEYDSVNSLFEEDETKLLKELHLKVGHIAELKWALKTMLLLEYPEIKVTDTKGEYAPSLSGMSPGFFNKMRSETVARRARRCWRTRW
jgi:hypothetical protein